MEKCRICGHSEFKFWINKQGYNHVLCGKCDTVFISPLPTEKELAEFYAHGYTDLEIEGQGHHLHFRDEYKQAYQKEKDMTFRDICFDLNGYKGKKALDVGCATGFFLEYMSDRQWDIEGTDISAEMVEEAVKKGLRAWVGDVFSVNDKRYQLITLWDVLEHLLQPKESLIKINSLLEPGGGLIIQTPCRGIIADGYGAGWRHFIPPQHVHIFSQQGLFDLLIKTGFRTVNWVSFGSGCTTGTTNPETKTVFDKVAKTLGIGDTIVVWAQKVKMDNVT